MASSTLETFSKRMSVLAKRVGQEGVNKVMRATAMAVDQALVSSTPVDTGRARSNWIPSVGSPSSDTRDPMDPSLLFAETAAVATLRKSGQSLYFSNNLPYIGRLNEGYSAQAPAGFVELAVQAGVDTIRRTKLLP